MEREVIVFRERRDKWFSRCHPPCSPEILEGGGGGGGGLALWPIRKWVDHLDHHNGCCHQDLMYIMTINLIPEAYYSYDKNYVFLMI